MNTIKKYPAVGDIVLVVDGKIRFVGEDATSEWLNTQQPVGVVYFVCGNHVKIVSGKDTTGVPWSLVADYEIETIPDRTGDYAVTLQGKSAGNFHYAKTAGTKEEFVQQLNTWLARENPKFEAYMHNGAAVLQLNEYKEYESANTIAGCKLRKRIGEEAWNKDITFALTQAKTKNQYPGICRPRMEEYCGKSKEPNCNPTSRMDGVTQLFQTFPCSETYYNGGLGDGLRKHYPTYGDYMDACMTRPWELDRGIMAYRDGKAICAKLGAKKVLVKGAAKPAYPAVDWALNYDAGVPGFGNGDWWLPTMHELALLMRDLTSTHKINVALGKVKGWNTISYSTGRWSCCRFSANYAWSFSGLGFASHNYFCYSSLGVGAVSAFNLKF